MASHTGEGGNVPDPSAATSASLWRELLFATQVLYEIVCRFGGGGEPLARIDDSDAIVDFEDQNLYRRGCGGLLGVGYEAPTVQWCGLGR